MKRIWILSEHYFPDETATGHILARIGEGLADRYEVCAICAQPTYHRTRSKAPSQEFYRGVAIRRCGSTNLDRNVIWKRLIRDGMVSLSIFASSLFRIRRDDTVLVVTNPPLLPFLTRIAAWIRGAKVVLLVHDVYPEVAVASGVAQEDSLLVRTTRWANLKMYLSMHHIVVLGRDMRSRVLEKLGADPADEGLVTVIQNWADVDEIRPTDRRTNELLNELGLQEKFVLQYAGNMGYVHDVETIVAAAALLLDRSDIHFLFIGSGAKQAWLEQEIERQGLRNITQIGQQPRSEQETFLNACDVAIMALLPGMLGVSVPSRSYNILAAGKPILGVLDKKAEIALMIDEECVGWVTEPRDPEALSAVIREISRDVATVRTMQDHAREVADDKYTFDHALDKFMAVFVKVNG
jgi:colanic acid biosynthesis glycosyl transferase WcaI